MIICLLLSGGTFGLVAGWFGSPILLASETAGPIGPAGADGATGTTGPSGPAGAKGAAGAAGAAGPAGARGATGADGAAGAKGAAGANGAPGSAGPVGPAGIPGAPGAAGADGAAYGTVPQLVFGSDSAETYAGSDGALHIHGVWSMPAGLWYVTGTINPKMLVLFPSANYRCSFIELNSSEAPYDPAASLARGSSFGGVSFWDAEEPQVSIGNFVDVGEDDLIGLACRRTDIGGAVVNWELDTSALNAIQVQSLIN